MAKIDFEAEGLLEGVEGKAREARLALLEELAADGVSLEELRRAVEEDRLVLLPVERVLAGAGERYSYEEIAREAGVDLDFLQRQLQALGLPLADPGEKLATEVDLEAARNVRLFMEAGLPEEGVLETARVIGMTMAQLADANRSLIGETFIRPGDNEYDLAMRYAQVSRVMTPLLGRTLEYVFRRHLLETIRQAVISGAELSEGRLPGSQDVAVAFADLVGFTSLGERLDTGEIGALSGRLSELAIEVAKPPVRLVKLIGDAAMLVSRETEPLLGAALDLVAAAEAENEMPPLTAGVAFGPALARGGDWYGRPVNLAARITGIARPGSVLAANEVKDAVADGGFRWSKAGRRRFKGIHGEVGVMRVRRAEEDGDGD